MRGKFLVILGLILLALLIGVYFLLIKENKIQPVNVNLSSNSIALSPSSGSFKVGQTFDTNILIDTGGKTIDGVDILYLRFDPKILEVVDSDSKTPGVQIKQGTLFSMYLGNTVDNSAGKISISGLVQPGSGGFMGSGVFATITFKAKAAGNAKVSFDFTPGSTRDANMAEHGTAKDILEKVINANYTITTK